MKPQGLLFWPVEREPSESGISRRGEFSETRQYRKPHARCSAAGCDNPAKIKGLCRPHYQRWRTEQRALRFVTANEAR